MRASPEQLEILRTVARRLGELRDEVVFVGGMIRGLLITDPGASGPRPTDDVDVIVEVASTAEYQTKLAARLRSLGFREDATEGAPICRWTVDGIKVDVMPTKPGVLGFSNRWYGLAVATANVVDLPEATQGRVSIRVVCAAVFCATKLEAYEERGDGDLYHHDLEDLIAVVDGRPTLAEELKSGDPALESFVAEALRRLFESGLADALPGHLGGDRASQARMPYVLGVLRRLASIA